MRRLIFLFFGSKKKTLISLLVLTGIVLFVFRGQWMLWIGDFLAVEDNLHAADVIHVIAGEDYRTDYALQLYKQGYGEMLFFTGGWCRFHHYYHGKHAQERALAQGLPMDDIAYDDSAVTSSYMEAERLKEWIEHSSMPIDSVIVVSDPFHMRRARWAYKKVLGDSIEVLMAPVPFDRTPFRQQWWKDRQSRLYVGEEFRKYVYYIFRYQISRGKFREWLVSLDRD